MAQVVRDSLQYAREEELRAMAVYLKALPDTPHRSSRGLLEPERIATDATLSAGEAIYMHHCADCHGKRGEGQLPASPPLAGNRGVTMSPAADPIRIVLFGGYPPGTAGNPRPFGMPPYLTTLSDTEIAQVLTFVRASWGNASPVVFPDEVAANRGSPLW
jgi:mono/diheme cytochrome c family protein